ncbi:hypothetical protein HR060_08910 [Catenovulum sp. SM1970]|uniref:DUF6351 family protein n=1 Tax=Marinifaba aquimaris TaxID=2741323 RepID=UPI001573A5F4|nr:DUF6351 family protein [Marinifaba aquimaris]NTS76991.1 hypothetical protein [Marinifaba aquimaris]
MWSRLRPVVVISLIAVPCLLVIYFWYNQEPSKYEWRQVNAVPPSSDNYLLPIYPHISQVDRPEETFSFPIPLGGVGPIESLYSGPKQYPFFCETIDTGLGQPIVDNQDGYGVPVFKDVNRKKHIVGYSQDCMAKTQLFYYQTNEDGKFYKISDQSEVIDGRLLIRAEHGVINRFIYTHIMPIDKAEWGQRLAKSKWNQKLIYQFRGGGGIGFRQGKQSAISIAKRVVKQLELGYAVISSSGNQTSYTYNMLLAEDTASRVKNHFISLYGEPIYTVGVGGSGGGLAQYLIAQNRPGVLDGLIPLYSYPDMLSQTIYALDCDLLNNYFTFNVSSSSRWQDWEERQLIEGTNTQSGKAFRASYLQPLNQALKGETPVIPKGNSECINGWFAQSSFIHNPKQGRIRPFYSDNVQASQHWSYWQDMVWLFGKDQHDFAKITWDNEGVQYGLKAFQQGKINFKEFMHINRKIGSWKPPHQMQEEKVIIAAKKLPIWLTLWSNHNINQLRPYSPRYSAPKEAIEAAYRGGQVFLGWTDLPIIDTRHYLDHKLDMHHLSASFSARLRLINANGHADNQVIWVAHEDHYPVDSAFKMMDTWLMKKLQNPDLSMVDAKPNDLVDTCFDKNGDVIASGEHVWDGEWNSTNSNIKGACMKTFPAFSNSRIQAGDSWAGDIFKCHRISVDKAYEKGLYPKNMTMAQTDELSRLFETGVCDYSLGDSARPIDLRFEMFALEQATNERLDTETLNSEFIRAK